MFVSVLLAMMSVAPVLKTPETSACFEKFTDPVSGTVSYLLKPGLSGHNQQSLYYTQKAMTDDGRFLVFVVSPDEAEEKYFRRQHLAILDFLSDRITVLDDFRAGTTTPYLDVQTDELFYLDRYSEDRSLWKRSLLGDMKQPVKVCAFPESAAKLGAKIGSLYTHLTRTADGKGFFLDLQVRVKDAPTKEDREMLSVLGVLDAGTGTFTEWYRNPYTVRHAAANPRRANVALALEPYWETRKEVHDCGKEGVCRRLLLLSPGKSELIVGQVPPGGKPPVHVVHTEWTADGSGIYWCSYDNGVILHNIDTGKEEVLMSENRAVHCEMTDDNRYIVFDQSAGVRQFRGQSWKVGFYDRQTRKTSWIYTRSPELMTPEKPSGLHPDPHPNFAMNGRYAICTMNVKPHQLSVLVTPTAQFMTPVR